MTPNGFKFFRLQWFLLNKWDSYELREYKSLAFGPVTPFVGGMVPNIFAKIFFNAPRQVFSPCHPVPLATHSHSFSHTLNSHTHLHALNCSLSTSWKYNTLYFSSILSHKYTHTHNSLSKALRKQLEDLSSFLSVRLYIVCLKSTILSTTDSSI